MSIVARFIGNKIYSCVAGQLCCMSIVARFIGNKIYSYKGGKVCYIAMIFICNKIYSSVTENAYCIF